ncbi:hypothetical protein APX70_01294 [Pseudomonas syringae pv. maculicola]|uniref:Uncharacterized protein n=1 Tax=Pseudomonas syringae pv. maculicola TaxID=59511 RepID=A0A3M3AWN4_PSEYM|nr:hypothetical protein APX70_01294 [Pseudomonas syringae pv. maculicola]
MPHGFEHAAHVLLAVDGHNDNSAWRLGHDAPCRLYTVHHGHDQVHQDQIRRLLDAALHSVGTIGRHPDDLVCRLESQRTT